MIIPSDTKTAAELDAPPPYQEVDETQAVASGSAGPSRRPSAAQAPITIATAPPPPVPPKRTPASSPTTPEGKRPRSASFVPPPTHPSQSSTNSSSKSASPTDKKFAVAAPSPHSPPSPTHRISPSTPHTPVSGPSTRPTRLQNSVSSPNLSPTLPPLLWPKSASQLVKATVDLTADLASIKSLTWFRSSSPKSDTKAEVTTYVQALLRDLVKPPTRAEMQSGAPPEKVLQGCREACTSYQLSLSGIVQDKAIEGHSAVYWAIVNGPTAHRRPLALTLVGFAHPMRAETYAEVRAACLLRTDQELFERLRNAGGTDPASGVDLMLGVVGADKVRVQDGQDEFVVMIDIANFDKRMKLKGDVQVEWIAKNRLWNLTFAVENKKWFIYLSLLEESPQTFVDARLLILDGLAPAKTGKSRKGRSQVPIPIYTNGTTELVALDSKKKKRDKSNTLTVAIDEQAESVRVALGRIVDKGPSYYSRNETLHIRFEVELRKHEENSSCVIC